MYSCTSRLRSPLAPNHSWVSRMIPRRSARSRFSTAVPETSPATRRKRGRRLVAQGVLQAGKLGAEGLQAIDPFREIPGRVREIPCELALSPPAMRPWQRVHEPGGGPGWARCFPL